MRIGEAVFIYGGVPNVVGGESGENPYYLNESA